jgi:opacity protein-like surface antigen
MKKLVFLPFLLMGALCYGQTVQFKQGQIDAQIGVGFVQGRPLDLYAGSDLGKSQFKFPVLFATLDKGVTDQISIGGYFNTGKASISHYYGNYETFSITMLGLRGLYHFDIHELFDVYAGAGLGYQFLKGTSSGYFFNDPPVSFKNNQFTYVVLAGGKYHFNGTMGAFVELGYGGVSMANLGLTLKLK